MENLYIIKKAVPVKVVLVSNLNSFNNYSVNEYHNLFSCFGRVTKMILMSNKGKCFIQFENKDFAKCCLVLFNATFFNGSKLKVSFSENHRSLKSRGWKGKSQKHNMLKIPKVWEHRFLTQQTSNIIAPNKTLLVVATFNKVEISNKKVYLIMKDMMFPPVKIKLIKGDGKTILISEYVERGFLMTDLPADKVLIAEYGYTNLQEALSVLCKAHHLKKEGVLLRVSFAMS